jgi:hypothetical protein
MQVRDCTAVLLGGGLHGFGWQLLCSGQHHAEQVETEQDQEHTLFDSTICLQPSQPIREVGESAVQGLMEVGSH